jgi:hypothetical protein
MTTVGYGDIVPISPNEKLFAVAAMLVACGMFGYAIGSISSVMEKSSKTFDKFRKNSVALNSYMRVHLVPYAL